MFHKLGFIVATLAAVSVGCGGASFPTVNGLSDPAFQNRQRGVASVDMLPVDLQVWTYRGSKYNPEALSRGLESQVRTMIGAELAERGYSIGASIDWDGTYEGGTGRLSVMTAEEVAVTSLALSSYGMAQARAGKTLLVPHLPVHLGAQTGSDATLYVGGWAYAGHDKGTSKGAKVAKGIGIGLLIVAVIGLAIIGAKKGGGALSGLGKGVAKAAGGVFKASGGFGRVAAHMLRTTAKGVIRAGIIVTKHGPRIAVETLDAWGRAGYGTHIYVHPQRVDFYAMKGAPKKGPSSMMLELTLIDNRTGETLWHARKRFRARPSKGDHVAKVVTRLMASLPASTGQAPGRTKTVALAP